MTLPLGDSLEGKYEILDKIGEGGMGSVYKVRHRLLEEIRVIKILRPHAAEMDDLQRRFLREARIAIKLKHPNIAQLHDFSIAGDGTAYIVMEFIDGIGLDAMIKSSDPPSLDLSVDLSMQALAALHYLHEHQFVHRDVSPDNLMLTSSFDGSPLIKLIDLGIAKNLDAEGQLTQTGVFLGKVRYCSPEQFSGKQGVENVLDRGSDIYSFGVLLYELLTGVYPFNGESFTELAASHLFQAPREFDDTDPDGRIPEGLRRLVLRALDKERTDRFATAEEFASEISAYRNPDSALKEEFDRTVEIAVSALPKTGDYAKPGSTQGRLNREFGLEKATATQHLTELRPAPGKREAPAKRTLAPGRLAAIAAIPVLALAAFLAWYFLSGEPQPPAEHESAAGQQAASSKVVARFEPIARWSALRSDGTGIDPDIIASVELPEPEGGETTAVKEVAASAGEEVAASAGEDQPTVAAPPPSAAQVEPGEQLAQEPVATPVAGKRPTIPRPSDAQIFEHGVGVVAPVLMELPTPTVPRDVKTPKEDLEFIVRVLVDERGSVLRAEIDSGPTFKRRLREEAIAAASRALYRPAVRNGVTGRMWTEIRIVFKAE